MLRSRYRDVSQEDKISGAKAEPVAFIEGGRIVDTLPIDERAVGRVQVPNFEAAMVETDDCVKTGDRSIPDYKIIRFVTAYRDLCF
jgi:hypothetical protein